MDPVYAFSRRSRTKNLMWYGVLGTKELLQRTYKNLEQKVQLEVRDLSGLWQSRNDGMGRTPNHRERNFITHNLLLHIYLSNIIVCDKKNCQTISKGNSFFYSWLTLTMNYSPHLAPWFSFWPVTRVFKGFCINQVREEVRWPYVEDQFYGNLTWIRGLTPVLVWKVSHDLNRSKFSEISSKGLHLLEHITVAVLQDSSMALFHVTGVVKGFILQQCLWNYTLSGLAGFRSG